MKYIIKKTMFYKGENKGNSFITKNFTCSNITDLMRKYPFEDYNEAFSFMIERQQLDYLYTIKNDKNFSFKYEIIEI